MGGWPRVLRRPYDFSCQTEPNAVTLTAGLTLDSVPELSNEVSVRISPQQTSGVFGLLACCLEDGLCDVAVALDRKRRGLTTLQEGREALSWLMHPTPSHLFAFQSLCDILDLDAPTIRANALTRTTRMSRAVHEKANRSRVTA